MFAPRHLRPTFIARDLRALNEPMPAPRREPDGRWVCGRAEAAIDAAGRLTVNDVTAVDALRAACCAAWEASDDGRALDADSLPDFDLTGAGE